MNPIGKVACVAAAIGAGIVVARIAPLDLSNTFWISLWGVLAVIVALPALVSVAADSKGQAASGWLMLVGIGVSVALFAIYLVALAAFFIVSFIF